MSGAVPIFRSLISVPAGVQRMPLPVFVMLTTLGSLIWNAVLVMAGYWLGDQWEVVETYVGIVSKVVLVLVVVALSVYLAVRLRGRNKAQHRRNAPRTQCPRGFGPGHTNTAIAQKLHISLSSVEKTST